MIWTIPVVFINQVADCLLKSMLHDRFARNDGKIDTYNLNVIARSKSDEAI